MSDLSGKYALVTGGGTGIGFGIAVRLLEAGATVTIAGRREDVLENSANELRDLSSSPDDIRIAVCDVTNEDDVKRAVDTASNDEGVLNMSVANAGIGAGGPFLTMDAETFR
ncbi:MAG TPA: SDR family NAD(P)-dependent oxidoreductase [Acidimicrobiales bacterium]|nr:SDR family NAD(P)-dependent oxidoreductase [Acidimicrobiales bacterium]